MSEMRSRQISDDVVRAALTLDPPIGLAEVIHRTIALETATTTQRRGLPAIWPRMLMPSGFAPFNAPTRHHLISIAATVGLLALVSAGLIAVLGSQPHLPAPIGLARPGLIAFDAGGDLFVSNADGTGRRQLTTGPAIDLQPTWSPDGTRLAYASLLTSAATVVVSVMDADGSHQQILGSSPASVDVGGVVSVPWAQVTWSPDGRHLAWTGRLGGIGRVFISDVDKLGSVVIGDATLEAQDPTWSPDGTRLVFRGGTYDKDRGIYVMDADGSHVRRLTFNQTDAFNVYSFFAHVWSPGGSLIAYENDTGGIEIRVVNVETGVDMAISTNSSADNEEPTWSPDGSRLAYRSCDGPCRFVVVDPDGSNAVTLPVDVSGNPVWSPDGRTLLGVSPDGRTLLGVSAASGGTRDSFDIINAADGTSMAGTDRGPRGATDQWIPSWQRLAD